MNPQPVYNFYDLARSAEAMSNIINVAPKGIASQSSLSRWSKDNDASRALTDDGKREFSFHTDKEKNPWWMVELDRVYPIESIKVINRRRSSVFNRARTLKVECSQNAEDWIAIHAGFYNWGQSISFSLEGMLSAKFLKLSLEETTYFHLSSVEIFVDQERDVLKKYFFIGSCRYQPLFPKHFPPRLHTTKEIHNFFNRFDSLEADLYDPNLRALYGDIFHRIVAKASYRFLFYRHEIMKNVDTCVFEISSSEYAPVGGKPLSAFYYGKREAIIGLSYDEMKKDLVEIKKMLLKKFNIDKIVIIPLLSLKKEDGSYIEKRVVLTKQLKKMCEELDTQFIDPSLCFNDGNAYITEAFSDFTHYSREGLKKVEDYLMGQLGIHKGYFS